MRKFAEFSIFAFDSGVGVEESDEFFFGIPDHGAEFEESEDLAVFADALLGVENTVPVASADVGDLDD